MSSEGWDIFKISDIGKIVTGKTPSTQNIDNFGEKYPFITPRDMMGQKKIDKTERYLSEEGKNSVKNCLLPANSICVSCIGSDMGKVVMTTTDSVTNQQLNSIICHRSFDPDFVYYALVNISEELRNAGRHSTAVPILNKSDFSNFEITAPDIAIQRRIAAILSALDEKIELNRQTNATLEAIAQAVFKEWFVDFHFPGATGEMQDSELGPIPKGWREGQLGVISKIKHGFAFKGECFSEEETDDILLTPGNFKIGGGFNHAKFKYYAGEYPSEYVLCQHDLVVTMTDLSKDGDTLGFPALVPLIDGKKILHNQRIGKVETDRNDSWKLYLYFVMQQKSYRDYVLSGATGSTVRHTSPSRICDHLIVMPPSPVLQSFENAVQALVDKIDYNHVQSTVLTQIRDRLLPKLMSGEIAV